MVAELLYCYRVLTDGLRERQGLRLPDPDKRLRLLDYEDALLMRHPKVAPWELAQAIPASRRALQRLIQLLCSPAQVIYARNWPRADLLEQLSLAEPGDALEPELQLELERWLTRQIAKILDQQRFPITIEEARWRAAEARLFRQRYRFQQTLQSQFV